MAGQQLYVKSQYFVKDNEYYTPKKTVSYFGKFDYDPATTKEKAEEFGIENYDTIETDELKNDWTRFKKIWINPPFTIKHEFLKKAVETYKADNTIYIYYSLLNLLQQRDLLNQCKTWLEKYIYQMEELILKVA